MYVIASVFFFSNRVAIGFLMSEEEGFYGFGERFTATNQRGHRMGSWLEDGSWGLGVFDPATWKLRVWFSVQRMQIVILTIYGIYMYLK